MGNEPSLPVDDQQQNQAGKKGKARGRGKFTPAARKGNMSSRGNTNTSNTANESWSFVRGTPPLELLRLPAQAPKRFSTRSAQQTLDASQATNVYPCFRGGGLLFRIVDPQDSGWWFYNDTSDMEMHLEYHFGPGSLLDVGEDVTVEPSSLPGVGGEGWQCASMIVFPGETLQFITGASRINGYKSVFRIAPLSEQVAQRRAEEIATVVAKMSNEMEVVAKLTADLGGGNTCLIEGAIVDRCARQQVPFVDLNFPPTSDSMYGFLGNGALLQLEAAAAAQQQQQQQSSGGIINNNTGGYTQPPSLIASPLVSGGLMSNNNNNNAGKSPLPASAIASPSQRRATVLDLEKSNSGNQQQQQIVPTSSDSEFTAHVRKPLNENDDDDDDDDGGSGTNKSRKQNNNINNSINNNRNNKLSSPKTTTTTTVPITISSITAEVASGSKFASEFGASDTQLTAQLESDARDLHRRLPPVVWMRPKQYLLAEGGFLGMNSNNNHNNDASNNNNNTQTIDDYYFEQQQLRAMETAAEATVSCLSRGLDVTDIELGFLGDHWLLSAITCVAEFHELIHWIFREANPLKVLTNNNNINNSSAAPAAVSSPLSSAVLSDITVLKTPSQSVGAYKLWLNVSGWWTPVILDDYIPCIGNKPAFASSKRDKRELWPILLQKSFAKILGSYTALVGGDPMLAIRTMTGCPTYRFDEKWKEAIDKSLSRREPDEQFITDYLLYPFLSGNIIVLNTRGIDLAFSHDLSEANQLLCQEIVNKYESVGLQMGCSYFVVDMKYFPQWKLFLMKIRNPWLMQSSSKDKNDENNNNSNNSKNNDNDQNAVTGSWNGHWSWQSEMWDRFPEVTAQCRPAECRAEGDNFWISWEDAINYFEGAGVCLYRSPSVDLVDRRNNTVFLRKKGGRGSSSSMTSSSNQHHHHQLGQQTYTSSLSLLRGLAVPALKNNTKFASSGRMSGSNTPAGVLSAATSHGQYTSSSQQNLLQHSSSNNNVLSGTSFGSLAAASSQGAYNNNNNNAPSSGSRGQTPLHQYQKQNSNQQIILPDEDDDHNANTVGQIAMSLIDTMNFESSVSNSNLLLTSDNNINNNNNSNINVLNDSTRAESLTVTPSPLLLQQQQMLLSTAPSFRNPLPVVDHRVMGQFIDSLSSVCLEVYVKTRTRVTFVLSQSDCVGARAEPSVAMMLSVAEASPSSTCSLGGPSSFNSPNRNNNNKSNKNNNNNSNEYTVSYNSTLNPLLPSGDFTFSFARDLSIVLDLEPTKDETPYLVIPRVFDAGVNKRYVLGLLSNDEDTNNSSSSSSGSPSSSSSLSASFHAKFVQINADSPFFLNRKIVRHQTTSSSVSSSSSFSSASSISKPVKARYQVKRMTRSAKRDEQKRKNDEDTTTPQGSVYEGLGTEFRDY